MAKKRTARRTVKRPRGSGNSDKKQKSAGDRPTKIVFDKWDSYVTQWGDETAFVSFDDLVTHERPTGLGLCARILVPIQAPIQNGGPVPPEAERLWEMEDDLCRMLRKHKVRCRLVARLTHGGMREIVFQLADWKSFRPPVGLWMMKHGDYEIDVSEHKGWDFFDQFVRPTEEDRIFMADRSVIDSLVESGSNPAKKHTLEYVFRGGAKGLRRVADALLKRGYKRQGDLDYNSGTIELAIRLPLKLDAIAEQSIQNHRLAEKVEVEFEGWGAAVVN